TRINVAAALLGGLVIVCAPRAATAGTQKVYPGDSIQAAIDAAAPGDKIVVFPGTYIESGFNGLTINKPLKMIGKKKGTEKVVLQSNGSQDDGILVEGTEMAPIVDFRIKGFTVQGFSGNGIHLRYVDGFRIDRNESIDNEENGIFPTLSANGMVKRNLSYGSADSALWVEASTDVRVLDNVLHSSPTGLEVTVSNNVEIRGNEVYNNTIGIGLYHPNAASLPPIPQMANWEIVGNYVHDNNAPNNAPPGSMSADLPPGGGILVLGTDGAKILKNLVQDNDFYGIAMVDWCLATNGSAFSCENIPMDPGINEFPELNYVQDNEFIGNGTNPTAHPLAAYAADITYIAFSQYTNCFANNTYATEKHAIVGPPILQNGKCL
ncbi:MAG TPA: right-handed parallel beta-helix repeat-containing protein, partial [Candidatus Binatia bacterium]|nr:right-handed parallel beta-helix repeat-containing protein [Candidatus Binatia bacterium]